ncbi:HAD family hydrolase [Paenibacillus sp. GCM10027626]|uniref:HAD family hydrolase n=1 Tax=Paenibacillus sp. GCM10027626 TaxID=3273411 RepID=UPI0036376328
MGLKFVWFDLGYTLVDRDKGRLYHDILRKEFQIEKPLAEVRLAFHQTDKLFMREYPGVLGQHPATYFPWYIGIVNYELKLALDLSKVIGCFRNEHYFTADIWKAYPRSRETLKQLKQAGYGVGLISNWDLSARQVLKDNRLDELLDEVIVSAEVGIEKPDPQIFQLALEKQRLRPEECLYVGDNYYDDVVGSGKVGMDCLLINRFGRTGIEELKYPSIIADVSDVTVWCKQHRGTAVI